MELPSITGIPNFNQQQEESASLELENQTQSYISKRRSRACLNCRRQKMKCQFSRNLEPMCCDRCLASGTECKLGSQKHGKELNESIEERLGSLEDTMKQLITALSKGVNSNNTQEFQEKEASMSSSKRKRSEESYLHIQESRSYPGMPVDDHSYCTSTPSSVSGPPSIGLLSEILEATQPPEGSLRIPLHKLYNPVDDTDLAEEYSEGDMVEVGLINLSDLEECIQFFNLRLAHYLPVLIFNYMPLFNASLRHRSPILCASVLAVASLYHPQFQPRHTKFRREFLILARHLDLSSLSGDLNESKIKFAVDVLVALALAGAWLGGELGFQMSILASDVIAMVFPSVFRSAKASKRKEKMCAMGLLTYIIEQRLRILHDRPADYVSDSLGESRRQKLYPYFVNGLSSADKSKGECDISLLKITAHTELCAVMVGFQQEFVQRVIGPRLGFWNSQLDRWLANWIGKLNLHLLPASWKPLLLTFHFAKLYLNQNSFRDIKSARNVEVDLNNTERLEYVRIAESAATDILERLLSDNDVYRLITYGPVFYPTMFVTAGALLLKVVAVAKTIHYEVNTVKIIKLVRTSLVALKSLISQEVVPCYETLKILEDGLNVVSKDAVSEEFIDAPISQEIETYSESEAVGFNSMAQNAEQNPEAMGGSFVYSTAYLNQLMLQNFNNDRTPLPNSIPGQVDLQDLQFLMDAQTHSLLTPFI